MTNYYSIYLSLVLNLSHRHNRIIQHYFCFWNISLVVRKTGLAVCACLSHTTPDFIHEIYYLVRRTVYIVSIVVHYCTAIYANFRLCGPLTTATTAISYPLFIVLKDVVTPHRGRQTIRQIKVTTTTTG